MRLTSDDRRQLRTQGLGEEEVERQLALFENPPPPVRLDRPATVDDGILRLDEGRQKALAERFEREMGRAAATKMVPASGAATRMFRGLEDPESDDARRLLDRLDEFPFAGELSGSAGAAGTAGTAGAREILDRLLGEPGLGYALWPKGVIPFHRYPDERGVRTPFEEHLAEAAEHLRDADGLCRLHFTVSAAHEALFRDLLATRGRELERRLGVRFEVSFSHQDPATDTVAVTPDNELFRQDDGSLLLRPGGHGALIGNLDALGRAGAELVFLKNIDNVVPDDRKPLGMHWKKVLGGLLLELREETPADRPLRVCGMVRNRGEPGGGPFWVRTETDTEVGKKSLQIVELSQIDAADPEQREIFERATHFNPVDLVCSVRDPSGEPWNLHRFVDPSTVFIAEKSHQGRPLKALERPGLWNGAMAGWRTVFVEVPLATFAPVKTVFDLLRPEHRAGPKRSGLPYR